ncbi:hypothetical protein P8452_68168 [Trifolium repens]|nr:hypothetical protein P8452_68168 [Trifolium repens]
MWCWCSNVVVIPPHTTPSLLLVQSVSATSLPRRRHRQNATKEHQVVELGNTLMTTNLESNSKQQISGSDVLWALQRASGRKKIMMKKKKKEVESGRDSETCVDYTYTNVRPLCINDHWGPKLDDLENRLRHLSDTIS